MRPDSYIECTVSGSRFFRLIRFLAFALALRAPAALTQNVTRDIPYTTDSTGTYRGDLYRPASTAIAPAVVYIHGGSWRSGNKGEMRHLATDLAAQGYVGFSIDYDLHSHSFPAPWVEVREAIRFLRAHAAEYGVDPQRIAVLGTSAGGELSALAGVAPQGPAVPPSGSTAGDVPVAAAVSLNGLYDLSVKSYIINRYLGGKCHDRLALCNDASPLLHVHRGGPPMFVGHGNRDHIIPYVLAVAFVTTLQSAGEAATPFIADGGGHSYWKKRRYYEKNLHAVEDFLDGALRTPSSAPRRAEP